MPTLQERLKSLLEAVLQDGQADLETLPNDHVCGHVISSEFDGLDYAARRQRIHSVLKEAEASNKMTAEDLLHVGTLLTYTPAEWAVVASDTA
ncbi:MAG: hypothetical protein HY718_21880 [Planctomycetes bacterium]|nr:hypothetical protein [Planctomycetota bacterium]